MRYLKIGGFNMITEDYVSFKIAKLLKEKGFDEDIARVVNEEGEIDYLGSFQPSLAYLHHTWYRCPTLQMTMKWLREKHHIDISVVPHSHEEGKPFDYEFEYWNGEEYHTPYNEKHPTYHELFGKTWEKYEEACEAGIWYCLKNLI